MYLSPKTDEIIPVGTKLSNDNIRYHFGGKNMGGLRYSALYGHLLVINNGDVDFFPDQHITVDVDFFPDQHITVDVEEIIIYFGEGNHGDQKISSGNKRLYKSNSEGTPLHYFIKEKSRNYPYNGRPRDEYTYHGLVKLINQTPSYNDFYTDDGRLIAKRGIDGIPTLQDNFTHKEAFKAIRGPYRAHFYKTFNGWQPYRDVDGQPRSVILFPLRKLEG